MGRLRVAAALGTLFLVLVGVAAAAVAPSGPPTSNGTGGAASSVDPLATQAAIDVLEAGGTPSTRPSPRRASSGSPSPSAAGSAAAGSW